MTRSALSRRRFVCGIPLVLTGCALTQGRRQILQSIEDELGGRIGVSVLDTRSGKRVGYRSTERFALCSTFKAPLAAAVLAQVDAGTFSGERMLSLANEPLLSTSPISIAHAKTGEMSVTTACEAAVSHSDNTAANLLLRLIGGPSAMTRFFRNVGDSVTRLDRYELELNSNIAGDPRDTTTPDAMLKTLSAIALGKALTPESRNLLTQWMLNEQRGKARIRAGVPNAWPVANKPGTSSNGATNDIAVVWTPERVPVVMSIYVNAPSAAIPAREQAIARIARASLEELGLVTAKT